MNVLSSFLIWWYNHHPLIRLFDSSETPFSGFATLMCVVLGVSVASSSKIGGAFSVVLSDLLEYLIEFLQNALFCEIEFRDTLDGFHYRVAEVGTVLWRDSRVVVDPLGQSISGTTFSGSYLGFFEGVPIWCYYNPASERSVFKSFRPFRIKLLAALQALANEMDERDHMPLEDLGASVTIYFNYREGGKLESGHRNLFCRSWNTINVAEETEQEIRDWLEFFVENPRYWRSKGLGWHTAIVLHGPPGNGKSSIAKALAAQFHYNLYTINLRSLKDEDLPRLPTAKGIYLIEDFSAINLGTQKDGMVENDHVSLSGLLNFIDGAWTPDGAVFIMTCNELPVLDEALRRPGRMDKIVYVGNATEPQIKAMWLRLHPEHPEYADRFAAAFPEGEYAMAQVESIILQHREVEDVLHLVETQLPPPYNLQTESLSTSAGRAGRSLLKIAVDNHYAEEETDNDPLPAP